MMLRAALIAMVFASAAHAAPRAIEYEPARTITVQGIAERYVVPDQAVITVNINALEKELVQAKSAHDRKLNKLMLLARDAGIEKKKIRANASNVQPHYESRRDSSTKRHESVLVGYRVFSSIVVTVDDTSKLAKLLEAVTSAGFEENNGQHWGNLIDMRYEIANPQKIRDDMLTDALANAKSKADNLASGSGGRILQVVQIAEGAVAMPRPMPMARGGMMAMEMAASAAPMAPPAGEQLITATVTVTYEIQ